MNTVYDFNRSSFTGHKYLNASTMNMSMTFNRSSFNGHKYLNASTINPLASTSFSF